MSNPFDQYIPVKAGDLISILEAARAHSKYWRREAAACDTPSLTPSMRAHAKDIKGAVDSVDRQLKNALTFTEEELDAMVKDRGVLFPRYPSDCPD